jgi:hypothetical protein
VTPYLIKPVPPGKQLKTPLDTSLAGNDLDFFLNGRPEVAKTLSRPRTTGWGGSIWRISPTGTPSGWKRKAI